MKPSAMRHLTDLIDRYPALETCRDSVRQAAEALCACYRAGGKALICGNGGSAADSEHIVGELMKSFVLPRKPTPSDAERLRDAGYPELVERLQRGFPAIALTGHLSLSTAVLNDTDPHMCFAQQVYVLGRPGDVLLTLSTSGNARNTVNAAAVARAFGLETIGLTGVAPSLLEESADIVIKAPATETFKVQELHLPIYHSICLMVEDELFG